MSPIQSNQPAAEAAAVSQAQSIQKHAASQTQSSAVPQDKVTISAAAQAKQTASAIGADGDHDGK